MNGLNAAVLLALSMLSSACGDDSSAGAGGSTTASSTSASSAGPGSGGSGPASASSGAGTGGTGGDGAGGAGGAAACNTLVNDGAKIDMIQVAEDTPMGAGGVIADGLYVLSAVALYTGKGGATGPHGNQVQSKFSTQGGAFEFVDLITNQNEIRLAGTTTTQGPDLLSTYTCPPDKPMDTRQFTATQSTLVLIFPQNAWTYTKQ